jgi:lipopolysaccharide export system protein LptA
MSGKTLAAALVLTASLAMGGLGGGALAQVSTSNPNAPIDISADEAEVVKDSCKTVWRGDAEALQDKTRLRARSITAFAAKKGDSCGDTTRLEADGDVYYVSPEQVVHGDHAVYNQSAGTVVVTGSVIVVQGKNVARGERLTIQVRTQAVTLEGPKGRGTPGRVRAVVFPDTTPQQ